MRAALAFAACLALAGSAGALSPVDPFDEGLKICMGKNPAAVAPAMEALHATKLTDDEIDRIRMGQISAYAYALLRSGRDQESVGEQAYPTPDYAGWTLGRVTVLTAGQAGGGQNLCTVTAPYDVFDIAVGALNADAAYGAPAKTLTFGGHRLAAWNLESGGNFPGALVLGGNFSPDRMPTTVQILMN